MSPLAAATQAPIGLGMYSYGLTWRQARQPAGHPPFRTALGFLQHAKSLKAAGVQVALPAAEAEEAPKIRAMIEDSGLYFEGQLQLPAEAGDVERFEKDVVALRQCGAQVARTAILASRRYETFKSAGEFGEFRERGRKSLAWALPCLARHRLKLAVENHKDWLVPELVALVEPLDREWVGVCVDTGNSIALLENPHAVIEGLAPFAFTTHLKDMAVANAPDGFLLSEVPLGSGFLDLPRVIATLRAQNPSVALNLEMITRDPLRIPCLTSAYWATLESVPAAQLAETLDRVKRHSQELPSISHLPMAEQLEAEERNVRQSLEWGKAASLPASG